MQMIREHDILSHTASVSQSVSQQQSHIRPDHRIRMDIDAGILQAVNKEQLNSGESKLCG